MLTLFSWSFVNINTITLSFLYTIIINGVYYMGVESNRQFYLFLLIVLS